MRDITLFLIMLIFSELFHLFFSTISFIVLLFIYFNQLENGVCMTPKCHLFLPLIFTYVLQIDVRLLNKTCFHAKTPKRSGCKACKKDQMQQFLHCLGM